MSNKFTIKQALGTLTSTHVFNGDYVNIPSVTTSGLTSYVSPDVGALVFNSTLNGFQYYNGTSWISLSAGTPVNTYTYTVINASTTVPNVSHQIVICKTGTPITVTLPDPNVIDGMDITVKLNSGFPVTIISASGSIDGGSSVSLTVINTSLTFVAISGNWYII